jgi:hypothetical protein
MKHSICTIAAAALLATGGLVVAANPAHAEIICGRYDSKVVGKYVVQNNRWSDVQPISQCINTIKTADGAGFTITKQDASAPTNGPPLSYPSVFIGCHYGNCSPGTNLPIQVKSISKAQSGINYKYVGNAIFDASYDIWLDPQPKKTGVNQMEVMIWLNKQGPIQPIGNQQGNVTIYGINWQVWSGSNGQNDVISYVATPYVPNYFFSVLGFLDDVRKRGKITYDFYLTSIQAGFEPWQGGVGLAVASFAANVTARGGTGTKRPVSRR